MNATKGLDKMVASRREGQTEVCIDWKQLLRGGAEGLALPWEQWRKEGKEDTHFISNNIAEGIKHNGVRKGAKDPRRKGVSEKR
jgi:hypothetical protein